MEKPGRLPTRRDGICMQRGKGGEEAWPGNPCFCSALLHLAPTVTQTVSSADLVPPAELQASDGSCKLF